MLTLNCFNLLLLKIYIYNEDQYEDINIVVTHYLVLLDATFDAWQAHNLSVYLIFPALYMLIKQKSPSLHRNLVLRTFGELLIVFSTKVNLLSYTSSIQQPGGVVFCI